VLQQMVDGHHASRLDEQRIAWNWKVETPVNS
jgi:hypothetical protein